MGGEQFPSVAMRVRGKVVRFSINNVQLSAALKGDGQSGGLGHDLNAIAHAHKERGALHGGFDLLRRQCFVWSEPCSRKLEKEISR